MKGFTQYVAVVLIGGSIMICAISHYETSKSEQKIENIKTLYELKSNLENKKLGKEIQIKIDSLENEK